MCTNSIRNYTNARFLRTSKPFQYVNFFPCGYCADCIRKKRSEWALRSYYHSKSTFDKGGFVLFDTLSYSDSNLKYFHDIYPPALYNCWDFSAFSSDDVQKFFKRLRTNISRGVKFNTSVFSPFFTEFEKRRYKDIVLPAYSDVYTNLDFLLTSEYGTKEGCTHRPHYHVLFFVTFPIKPEELSLYIAYSWLNGRTDGLPFKHKSYLYNDRLLTADNPNNLKLTRYVTKYISKDMYLHRKLFRRVFMSYTISNPNWMETYSGRLAFRRFKNQVLPFHRQSEGFGLSALQYEDSQYIDDHGAIRMPVSSAGVIASIPLPLYYRRKIYFDAKWVLGKLSWIPNDRYFRKRMKDFNRSVVNLRNRLFSFDNSIGLEKSTDIARYQLVWRGKCVPRSLLSMADESFFRYSLLNQGVVNYFFDNGCIRFNEPVLFNLNHESDFYKQRKCVSDIPLSRLVNRSRVGRFWSHREFEVQPPEDLVVVSSKTVSRFAGYDDILDEFRYFNYLDGISKDYDMFQKDVQIDRYKMLGFLES